ncbi:secretin receptor-like isoform X3 [Aphidius gifuensis]|uniref:secretin receptor-like isoform X3 n=1 Tax=Aphidius gifuensis TaxID=684658 RepID=UPI001CDB7EF3|nr:secretin receptor-like isoform X3 [Aphidius gifuensis]
MNEEDIDVFIKNQKDLCNFVLTQHVLNVSNYCSSSFDGLLCWPITKKGMLATQQCPPKFVMGYKNSGNPLATKQCMPTGKWYENHESVKWSNYSLCKPPSGFYVTAITNIEIHHSEYENIYNSSILHKWVPIIKNVANVGYTSSLCTLIIAMIIFSLLRKLRNPRNRLHMHMFGSFIMRASMSILKNWLFIDGVGMSWDMVIVDDQTTFIKEKINWFCKVITSLWQYSIVANYAWILMEGLYLHNLIFLSFCGEKSDINYYIFSGWIFPAIVVSCWITVRIFFEDTFCWTTHDNPTLSYIIQIPIMLSTVINFFLFINLVRVLLIKMKISNHLQRKKMQYKQWARSTLILIPLFGAHYTIVMGLSYSEDPRIELIWIFWDQLFSSFQGCFVACLYCLLNSEVRDEIKRAWQVKKLRHDSMKLSSRNRTRSKHSSSSSSSLP